ncbi:MAG TPA: hemerythrin domain-containing protein [Kofleriaceae bacterium]|nr:hemerythrin domain-containing protein [Kofleriaceae bacterium]
MKPIRDALELLTAQHEELDELCDRVARSKDAAAFALLADKLPHHLAVEQELLYPAIGAHVSRDVMNEVLAEHVAIKHLLAKLVWAGVEDPEFSGHFECLRELLVGHSAWQEDQLFTTAAESLPADRLAILCDELQAFDNVIAVAA